MATQQQQPEQSKKNGSRRKGSLAEMAEALRSKHRYTHLIVFDLFDKHRDRLFIMNDLAEVTGLKRLVIQACLKTLLMREAINRVSTMSAIPVYRFARGFEEKEFYQDLISDLKLWREYSAQKPLPHHRQHHQ